MFRDPLGGKWGWQDVRSHLKYNLLRSCREGSEFGFGMYWGEFSNCLYSPYRRDKDRKRVDRFREKIWNRCLELRANSK